MTDACKICQVKPDDPHDWFCPRGKDDPLERRTPEDFAREAHDAMATTPFLERPAVLARLFERAMRQGLA